MKSNLILYLLFSLVVSTQVCATNLSEEDRQRFNKICPLLSKFFFAARDYVYWEHDPDAEGPKAQAKAQQLFQEADDKEAVKKKLIETYVNKTRVTKGWLDLYFPVSQQTQSGAE